MKRLVATLLCTAVALTLTLSGCTSRQKPLVVGATAVPHAQILAVVAAELKKEGIELKVVEFNDYVQPNLQLAEKQLDANFFQHIPYLEKFSAEHKLDLTYIARVHIEPVGLYTQKHSKDAPVTAGAKIALPNDVTNLGRALLLLQSQGLIKLKPETGITATPLDIVENPQGLKFVELEGAQLPRALADVDYAVINGNFALQAGLNPVRDSVFIEGSDSVYVNVLAVRKESASDPRLQKLAAALNSPAVREFIEQTYQGSVVPAFK
jgi:D-methionine transport system substrate-binding protein